MALESPTEAVGAFLRGFIGQRPVYRKGVQIGYWTGGRDALTQLCAGTIMLYKGADIGPISEWYTKDDLWRDVPVTSFCLAKGIKPASISVEEAAAIVQKPTGELVIPCKYNDAGVVHSGTDVMKLAAFGALGLGALLLVLRR